jgi:hypothetical protein
MELPPIDGGSEPIIRQARKTFSRIAYEFFGSMTHQRLEVIGKLRKCQPFRQCFVKFGV